MAALRPSFVLPPIPHPHPYEHIAVIAADDGLVLFPHSIPERAASYVRVSWGKNPQVQEVHRSASFAPKPSVVVYGIVGILDLFNASYLLVITARSHAGCLFDDTRSIYSVKSVRAIPLVGKERAEQALDAITTHASSPDIPDDVLAPVSQQEDPTSDTHAKFTVDGKDVKDIVEDYAEVTSSGTSTPTPSESLSHNVAKAFADKVSFWTRLSKRQPTDGAISSSDDLHPLDPVVQSAHGAPSTTIPDAITVTPPPESAEERHTELEDRVIRECIREYVKGCMYFAYHFDITRSLQDKHDQFLRSRTEENLFAQLNSTSDSSVEHLDSKMDPLIEPLSMLPLWRRVNREFWWNEWLSRPFIEAGVHSYVLPIVQGYFQVSAFSLPHMPDLTSPVDYVIASRRSRYRAGLRYQRRGVDEDAHVANFVETETIMRIKRSEMTNVFSFVQIRGSIPLYWTQSGYSMKPPPVLLPECTSEQNSDAMRRHFRRTIAVYGPHTIVNLAEQTGKESTLSKAYKSYVERMKNKDVCYCEYDFHHETKGMKYENISKLINDLERTFESQGYFWNSDYVLLSKQKSVFRVNCIDCLDRTNVVQSAFARHILGKQLEAVGLAIEPQSGRSGVDIIFNDVWANNGDTISRAYAGTSALKGDFTRTGKRDLGGLFNDGINSLARMYSATFSDWFCQAVIDYMLGYRTISVFSEFLLRLQSTDPRELIRLSRIRTEAIATSVSCVLDEGEPLLAGWTLIAPEQLNVKISDKFEEKVLLLSARALYIVGYEYAAEKVKGHTRIPLETIIKITKGAYILSPLEEASRDPTQNAGFSVTWLSSDISLRTSRHPCESEPAGTPRTSQVRSRSDRDDTKSVGSMLSRVTRVVSRPTVSDRESTDTSFAAFKVLPLSSARVRNGSRYSEAADDLAHVASCKEAVDLIVASIGNACKDVGGATRDEFICESDIVSVSEAQRTTSIYAKMEYGVKRLLWLGG